MRRDRPTSSSALRAIAIGVVAAPLGIAWSAASCVIVDPPPELLTIPNAPPSILGESAAPPEGQIITNASPAGLNFTVPVRVVDTTQMYQYVVIEDYRTSNSSVQAQGTFGQPDPDGGDIETIPQFSVPLPTDLNCHNFWLFVGLDLAPQKTSGNGYTISAPYGSNSISWFYNPAGSVALCPSYDAGGLADSAADDTIEEVTDAEDLDAPIVTVGE